ncbi:hypothetical protein KR018_008003, partial [Drosophila ironensis]
SSLTPLISFQVADLKRELKLRGLPTNGNKTELQDRLQTAMLEGDISLEDGVIADAIDDDVSLSDEDEQKLLGEDHEEEELLKSPIGTPTAAVVPDFPADKSSLGTTAGASKASVGEAAASLQSKKIVLKRNNSQQSGVGASAGSTAPTTKENTVPSTEAVAKEATEATSARKHTPIVVGEKGPEANKQLMELTSQERLELRAKKFGITAQPETPTAAAANKSSSASITANKGNKDTEEQQKEALKRRAERFGCVVPEKTNKSLAEERLQKRKERFGSSANTPPTTETDSATTSTDSKNVWCEKARARLERFKTTPATK